MIMISDGEDHSEGAEDAAEEAIKRGIKIITIGVGTEKGGPIPLKRNGIVESFQRDNNDEVVITKLNSESLQTNSKNSKGGYVNGNNTQAKWWIMSKTRSIILKKPNLKAQQLADFNAQFQWFLGIAFVLLLLDVFLLERKTNWVQKAEFI